jgi:hypothetical protein
MWLLLLISETMIISQNVSHEYSFGRMSLLLHLLRLLRNQIAMTKSSLASAAFSRQNKSLVRYAFHASVRWIEHLTKGMA